MLDEKGVENRRVQFNENKIKQNKRDLKQNNDSFKSINSSREIQGKKFKFEKQETLER